MANDDNQLDRREVITWLTAAPATLAVAQVLNGCDSGSESGPDIGASVTPDSDAGLQQDSMSVVADSGAASSDTGVNQVDAGAMQADAEVVNCSVTTSDALGPFYSTGAPRRSNPYGNAQTTALDVVTPCGRSCCGTALVLTGGRVFTAANTCP